MKNLLKLVLMSTLFSFAIQSFAQETSNIFSNMIGDCEVILLSDGQSQGKAGILIGAEATMLEEYVPDGTFPNACNAFLVKTPEKNILIDTGTGAKLFENLAAIDVDPSQIDAILITHMHGDHIGGLLNDGQAMFLNADIYLAREEYYYWANNKAADLARTVIGAYQEQLKLFDTSSFNGEMNKIIPSVTAIAAHGHTPGHTMYMITSDGQQLLFWGDLTHAMAIQMPYPEVAVTYDVNPEQAVETRIKVLDYIAKQNIPVAGMHIPFPAMGTIKSEGTGYVFEKIKSNEQE